MLKFICIVFFSDFIWDDFDGDVHVFLILHWCVDVEVFTYSVMNLAFGEEITLLSNNLIVFNPAVLVDNSP